MKKKVIYSIIIVSVIIILSVAVTYAVYTFSGVVNISGTSECFEVNYIEYLKNTISSSLTNAHPSKFACT